MRQLFILFSIMLISLNLGYLNASNASNNFNGNASFDAHQQHSKDIHDMVWDNNLSNVFKNIVEISHEIE